MVVGVLQNMKDLVVGQGEIGKPLADLIESKGVEVHRHDLKNPIALDNWYDYVHICIPWSDKFIEQVALYKKFGTVVIHSTVKPGASKQLDVIYSPVRGVHERMDTDLERYVKYYSGNPDENFERRFNVCKNVQDSTTLEYTKIMDTTYYGWLIAFRKYIDSKFPVYWDFCNEAQTYLGNRPVMYNDFEPIGGHCVIENLELINDSLFNHVVGMWSKKNMDTDYKNFKVKYHTCQICNNSHECKIKDCTLGPISTCDDCLR